LDKQELVEYWVKAADLDFPVMENLFKCGNYVWSLYIGHLIVEKILKAFFSNVMDFTPPKTHNLVKLAEISGLTNDAEKLKLLDEINEFNIGAIYPDKKFELYKKCGKEFTESYLLNIKELYFWIKSQII
jgi:HEPN domain-containing protein